jgi:hypothetical protein
MALILFRDPRSPLMNQRPFQRSGARTVTHEGGHNRSSLVIDWPISTSAASAWSSRTPYGAAAARQPVLPEPSSEASEDRVSAAFEFVECSNLFAAASS